MGSNAKKWASAAAESFMRANRSWRLFPSTPKTGYRKLDLEGGGDGPAICPLVMLFLSLAMFTSTLILLQSLKNSQGLCFLPIWGSASPNEAAAAGEPRAKIDEDIKANNKAWLLKQAEENGTSSCDQVRTTQALVFGFERPARGNIRLRTNEYHRILVVSYTEDGTRRCSGGDFYETDLSGANWKSRPPVKDLGDGSYLVELRVDSRMAGLYKFNVVLLFSNLHGLDLWPDPWVEGKEVIHLQLEFIDPSIDPSSISPIVSPSKLKLCTHEDFKRGVWHGRWTKAKANESCVADTEGRFKCLRPNEQCERPWCEGPLGRLESNGWVYSAHCAFQLFTEERAWSCLQGRWLFFWGDSNHQDTIRNLLNFVLGLQEGNVGRTFETIFSNPHNSSQVLKITSFFNGHYEESGNNLGLNSLNNSDYRTTIQSYFLQSNQAVPDTVILNSGLHDGKFWPSLNLYAEGAHLASMFWGDIRRNVRPDESQRPRFLFRTTVAPAGESRKMPSNPHKMEVFNTILGEELVSVFGQDSLRIVDAYDMTFPWHFDNKCSDGGHYGRPPSLNSWLGITTGHQYFVDVMLAHILLNAICPPL